PQRRGPSVIFDFDEHPRRDTTIEKLTKLKPVFGEDGTITAGNAPGINDGAVAMIVSSSKKVKELGIKPIAKIIDYTQVATDPKYFAITPALAIKKLLAKNDMTLKDIDLIEINEAFAAVSLVCIKILGINPDILNVNGGAVAIGHPIGASGGRILMTLIYELRRRGLKKCIPITFSGLLVADAISVIDNDEVFVDKMVSWGQISSNFENIFFFKSIFSGAASITRSTSLASEKFKVVIILLSALFFSSSVNLPFTTPLDKKASIFLNAPFVNFSSISYIKTPRSDCAQTCAIPEPICPAPITIIFFIIFVPLFI
ncbi:unnamed protein product, partial [marine sediment metagenome]